MPEFLQQYGLKIIVAAFAAVLLFAPKGSFAWLIGLVPAAIARLKSGGSATIATTDLPVEARTVAEVQAFKLLKASAVRRKCKEANAAIDTYGQFFFTDCNEG